MEKQFGKNSIYGVVKKKLALSFLPTPLWFHYQSRLGTKPLVISVSKPTGLGPGFWRLAPIRQDHRLNIGDPQTLWAGWRRGEQRGCQRSIGEARKDGVRDGIAEEGVQCHGGLHRERLMPPHPRLGDEHALPRDRGGGRRERSRGREGDREGGEMRPKRYKTHRQKRRNIKNGRQKNTARFRKK